MANTPAASAASASESTTASTVTLNNTIEHPIEFLNPKRSTRTPKIKWTAENVRKLVLLGFGKETKRSECVAIAATFPDEPNVRPREGCLTEMRHDQKEVLKVVQLEMLEHEVAVEAKVGNGEEGEKDGRGGIGGEVEKKGVDCEGLGVIRD